jgi:hypothetical protein
LNRFSSRKYYSQPVRTGTFESLVAEILDFGGQSMGANQKNPPLVAVITRNPGNRPVSSSEPDIESCVVVTNIEAGTKWRKSYCLILYSPA